MKKNMKGIKMFLAAHHFLWTYPKNRRILASSIDIGKRNARGEPLWKWIQRIAALKEKKIVWDPFHEVFFGMSIDGTDYRTFKEKHPVFNKNPKTYSQKFNHGALKYEVGLSIFKSKCVWINGPFRGGKSDIDIFRAGLKKKCKDLNFVMIADGGYQTSADDEKHKFSIPDKMDSKELYNFKTRVRSRHEAFNGRLKKFECLNNTFRHGTKKHKYAFEAVVVIVQYQMDNGSPLFAH